MYFILSVLVQVICVTYLPLVGYTILLRDLLAPLLEVLLDRSLDGVARNLMVSALVVLVRRSTPQTSLRIHHPHYSPTIIKLRHTSHLRSGIKKSSW